MLTYYPFLHSMHLCRSQFPSGIVFLNTDTFFYYLLLCKSASFKFSQLHLSEKVFILFSFVQDILAGYRILAWHIFFSTLKMSFHSLLVYNFLLKIGNYSDLCSTLCLSAFKILSLLLNFNHLIMIFFLWISLCYSYWNLMSLVYLCF